MKEVIIYMIARRREGDNGGNGRGDVCDLIKEGEVGEGFWEERLVCVPVFSHPPFPVLMLSLSILIVP